MCCYTPLAGSLWILPLMFVFCLVMMFFIMRAFFGGRFPFCMRPDDRGRDDTLAHRRGAGDDAGGRR